MMKKSEIVQGVILCWDLDHPLINFGKTIGWFRRLANLSFKIEILVGTDEVKEIYFDSEFFTRMKISSPEEAYSNFVRKDEKTRKRKSHEKAGVWKNGRRNTKNSTRN